MPIHVVPLRRSSYGNGRWRRASRPLAGGNEESGESMTASEVFTTKPSGTGGGRSFPGAAVVRASGPSDSRTTISMGRTLHYAIYDDPKNYWEAWREIRIAQEFLIDRSTWTCETPDLRFLKQDIRERTKDLRLYETPLGIPIADGTTNVADDEWNATLIIRFATWLSRRLPTATVVLHDEGDYLTPCRQIRRAGVAELDHDGLREQQAYLERHCRWDALEVHWSEIDEFPRGKIRRSIPAQDYADRREIRALEFAPEVLARMTLDEVAEAIAFPWTTEGLGAT